MDGFILWSVLNIGLTVLFGLATSVVLKKLHSRLTRNKAES
jgi:hypothetical protein